MKVDDVLGSIDWLSFEDVLINLTVESIAEYSAVMSDQPLERIYQISIQTNPQILESSVGFETIDHAKRVFFSNVGITDETELEEAIKAWEPFDYETAAADFKYYGFKSVSNLDLEPLSLIDIIHNLEAVDTRIEASLLRVVDRIKTLITTINIHSEAEIWIGVSSPRDWYDDRVRVRIR